MVKVGIIGYGNMGQAIAQRIIDKYAVSVFEKDKSKVSALKNLHVAGSLRDLAKKSEVIILAVKPQDIKNLLLGLKLNIRKQLVVSIAAGILTDSIEDILDDVRVIRAMPNLPAKIGKGMICICKGKNTTSSDLNLARNILSNLGKVLVIEERLMDETTVVSGSGPGYFYRLLQLEQIDPLDNNAVDNFAKQEFIPTITASAVKIGFSNSQAKILATFTTSGTIALLRDSNKTPAELEKQVTSKKGTTEAGLKKIRGIKTLYVAIKAALKRAKELSKSLPSGSQRS